VPHSLAAQDRSYWRCRRWRESAADPVHPHGSRVGKRTRIGRAVHLVHRHADGASAIRSSSFTASGLLSVTRTVMETISGTWSSAGSQEMPRSSESRRFVGSRLSRLRTHWDHKPVHNSCPGGSSGRKTFARDGLPPSKSVALTGARRDAFHRVPGYAILSKSVWTRWNASLPSGRGYPENGSKS